MLDKILIFIKERLVALNSALNNLTNKLNGLTSTVNTLNSDTGWQPLTKSTNWDGSDDIIVYRKIGNVVEIRYRVTSSKGHTASPTPLLLATNLPASIRPSSYTVRSNAYHNGKTCKLEVFAKGTADEGRIRVGRANGIDKNVVVDGQVTYTVGGVINLLRLLLSPNRKVVGVC